MNACEQLLSRATPGNAEAFAASVDISEAGFFLEQAIYAGNAAECAGAALEAAQWVSQAASSYARMNSRVQGTLAECAAAQLTLVAGEVPSDPGSLEAFQLGELYPFHGVLAQLKRETQTVGAPRDASLDLVAVLGAVVITVIAAGRSRRRRA